MTDLLKKVHLTFCDIFLKNTICQLQDQNIEHRCDFEILKRKVRSPHDSFNFAFNPCAISNDLIFAPPPLWFLVELREIFKHILNPFFQNKSQHSFYLVVLKRIELGGILVMELIRPSINYVVNNLRIKRDIWDEMLKQISGK